MDKSWKNSFLSNISTDPAPLKARLPYGPQLHLICNMPRYPGTQLPCVDATPSLPTWGTRECPTTPNEAGMLGYNYKTHKFPTQKLLLDRELGGLLFTP
ncbi:hypothetical protein L3X38_011372 [Prunus dulcis]|uniref:Uncharacterized protein n=1 Tax=Prunus dulcis TaxID=3755 RepID=A0AAD4WHZ5_PRUDU|nr:hypothetical protein L3X38_011372 [Prunus dulcis]